MASISCPCAAMYVPVLTSLFDAAEPAILYTVDPPEVTYASCPVAVTIVIVLPLTDCTRPNNIGRTTAMDRAVIDD